MVDERCRLGECVSNADALVVHLLCTEHEGCEHRTSAIARSDRVKAVRDAGGSGHNGRCSLGGYVADFRDDRLKRSVNDTSDMSRTVIGEVSPIVAWATGKEDTLGLRRMVARTRNGDRNLLVLQTILEVDWAGNFNGNRVGHGGVPVLRQRDRTCNWLSVVDA